MAIQTDLTRYRDAGRMLEQGRRFAGLASNIQVKFPAPAAGLVAIEEATYLGISINATVSFTVPQALAVGRAVEQGLERREAVGLDPSEMSPVCTVMMGRLDDWMMAIVEHDDIVVDPAAPNWAGIAVYGRAHWGSRPHVGVSGRVKPTLRWPVRPTAVRLTRDE